MNVSVIITIKNEEKSIELLLASLKDQSKIPNEIVIVDGGSSDNSLEIIKSFSKRCSIPIKLIVKNGINIAEGRNEAIRNSNNDIIASTDAGCKLSENWLENLIKPFEENPDVDVVSGWYEPYATNDFEKISSELTSPKLKRFLKKPDDFLPSSRSIAFKKQSWESVGGYPEYLYTAEDTLFDLKLKEKGFKFAFASDAIVFWKVRKNMKAFFKQYFIYRKGDGNAKLLLLRYWGPKYMVYLIILLLFLGLLYKMLTPLFVVAILGYILSIYIILPTIRTYQKIKIKKTFLFVPFLILIIDFCGIFGYIAGSFERIIAK